jgi:hypothetical protein
MFDERRSRVWMVVAFCFSGEYDICFAKYEEVIVNLTNDHNWPAL